MRFKFMFIAIIATAIFSGCGFEGRYSNKYTNIGTPNVSQSIDKGNYVALAYSRAANTVYLGRSIYSSGEALSNAIKACSYSDCKAFYVINHDGCVSFAKSNIGTSRWGKAQADTSEKSEMIALKYCNAELEDNSCAIIATLCPEF